MPKAMCFGTFDGLHEGHRDFLKQASVHGTLRVIVARDTTVMQVKGRPPLANETKRVQALKDEGYDAVLGNQEDKYAVIEEYRPECICLGYDQVAFTDKLEISLLNRGITSKIIRLDAFRPEVYKSSKLNAYPHLH